MKEMENNHYVEIKKYELEIRKLKDKKESNKIKNENNIKLAIVKMNNLYEEIIKEIYKKI